MRFNVSWINRVWTFPPSSFSRTRRRTKLAIGLGLVGVAGAFIAVRTLTSREAPDAALVVTSAPGDALIDVDGRPAGQAPITIPVESGEHLVAVHDPRYSVATASVRVPHSETVTVRLDPWLRNPLVRPLHPSFPGAAIDRVDFLSDGRVAIGETLPPGIEHQLWLLNPSSALRQVGPRYSRGPLALAPNGKRVAFLDRDPAASPSDAGPNEVFVAPLDGVPAGLLYRLAPGQGQLFDLTWAPDAAHLLVIARQHNSGDGVRTHFLWIRSDGVVDELASVPTDVVPDSYAWNPDGQNVAFLTSTDALTSLCLLDTSAGTFTYLADLARDDTSPVPFPPLAWSPDGKRLIYAAPSSAPSGPTGWLLGGKPPVVLFHASIAHPFGARIGEAEGQTPVWRSDDSVVALAPDRGGSLRVRLVAPDGSTEDVGTIPIVVHGAFAVRWDVAHRQGLLVTRAASSQNGMERQFWLVQFRPGGEE